MKTYDDVLPFLNRTLYSYHDSMALWQQFENDIPRLKLTINNSDISTTNKNDHVKIHDFFYNELSGNTLLTKYTLASCTQAIFAQPFAYLQDKLNFYVIGECIDPVHMTIHIKSFHDYLDFTIIKRLGSYNCKKEIITPATEYDINIHFQIYKQITKMTNQKVCTTIQRVFK